MPRVALALTLVFLSWPVLSAQNCTPTVLPTTFAGGLSQPGIMFDLRAVAPSGVTICSLDLNAQNPGTVGIVEVYTTISGGSYVGSEANASAWRLIASGPVLSAGAGSPSPLSFRIQTPIASGSRRGFYVTYSDGNSLEYTAGVMSGNLFATDGNLEIFEGIGKSYPFGTSFPARVFNGNVSYCLGTTATCARAPVLPYERNSRESTYEIGGLRSNGYSPAITEACINRNTIVFADTDAPNRLFELALAFAPPVAGPFAPALVTLSGTQVLNVDISQPTFSFFFGGPVPLFFPHPQAISIPVRAPAALTVTSQQIVLDAANPDGFDLSQAASLRASAGGGVLMGPNMLDSAVVLRFGTPPLCSGAPMPFYGTTYTEAYIISNGRITFGGADTSFLPDPNDARFSLPFVGAWCDLAADSGGFIGARLDPQNRYRIEWTNVPYSSGSGANISFAITLDPSNGRVALRDLAGIQVDFLTDMFLGMSPGLVGGATDPGPRNFSSGSGSTTNATSMLYEYGLGAAGSLAPGRNVIEFNPNALGNYNWTAF